MIKWLLSFPAKTAPAEAPEAPAAALKAEAGNQGKGKAKGSWQTFIMAGLRRLMAQEVSFDGFVADERDSVRRHQRLMSLVRTQALVIGALTGVLIFGAPVMQPVQTYWTVSPQQQGRNLVPLFNPNLTNAAILSWAATSVTEIMTLGFGDFDQQLIVQRKRFTPDGWDSFLRALIRQNIRSAFKEQQLILTTVPSDNAVVLAQGEDIDHGYKWLVELPVIMTFATNNNVTKKSRSIVRLTIVRVPSRENVGGIAISTWNID